MAAADAERRIPRRMDGLEVNEAEDGLVVYDPEHDMVHHLNESASLLFDLCDGTRDVEEIARVLGEAFGVDPPPHGAALEGLRDLAERDLVAWDAHEGEDG